MVSNIDLRAPFSCHSLNTVSETFKPPLALRWNSLWVLILMAWGERVGSPSLGRIAPSSLRSGMPSSSSSASDMCFFGVAFFGVALRGVTVGTNAGLWARAVVAGDVGAVEGTAAGPSLFRGVMQLFRGTSECGDCEGWSGRAEVPQPSGLLGSEDCWALCGRHVLASGAALSRT